MRVEKEREESRAADKKIEWFIKTGQTVSRKVTEKIKIIIKSANAPWAEQMRWERLPPQCDSFQLFKAIIILILK